ncbi:hypothetical protein [Ovoidimarina sediminis]|uniref:hypothetical protein n=1 Tax=Ovoidimarina sediminis TaxID=3079856 RepID=UPI00290A14FA|nr:hypothetical protein [Rhodophyticola sp. MJ-SS7]MDU8941986.1 hypothetical protein [Rhodophyticola sp. MJ-SS7]
MLTTLIVTALIDGFSIGPPSMACSFVSPEPGEPPVEIMMIGRPSLKDLPGLYRVEMDINGRGLKGAAQPIIATEGRDVLVRARRGEDVFYAIGFDESGTAALNIVWGMAGEEPEKRATLTGKCRNHEKYIQVWSAQ